MTTLCAYIEPISRRTWIGYDSRVTQSHGFIMPTSCVKARRIGTWWIAVSGNQSAIDHIDDARDLIATAGDDARAVVRVIQSVFKDLEYRRCNDHSGAPCYEQYYMLVQLGIILSVSGSGSIVPIDTGFWAEGSGREYALGVACAETNFFRNEKDGRGLLTLCLEIAAQFDSGTGGKICVEEVRE